jgi:hypothetical protein
LGANINTYVVVRPKRNDLTPELQCIVCIIRFNPIQQYDRKYGTLRDCVRVGSLAGGVTY